MAGFADLVRDMVALADSLTSTLQASVTHKAWSGATKDAYGKVTWPAGTARKCVIESGVRIEREDRDQPGGVVTTIGTKLTFPRPILVDTRDLFVLPDGTNTTVLKVSGVVDPDATSPYNYATEVYLGVAP